MLAKGLVFFFLLINVALHAQTDSLRLQDSIKNKLTSIAAQADSIKKDSPVVIKKAKALTWQQDTAFNRFFYNKNLPKNKQAVFAINVVRDPAHEDIQFYILAGLLLFAGIVRVLFPKYFTTLFQVFFQSSQHQRLSAESFAHDALPSFLMNLFFVFSGGLLITTLIKENETSQHISFLFLWLYASAALAIVYIIKSVFITFFGWAFTAPEPAANYRFIVFLVNKMAGLAFIPLLLSLTYSGADVTVVTTITITLIVILLLYRYIISLSLVGKKLKVNPLHFFLYLCAAEILPLLITYKVLLMTKEL